MSEDDWMDEPTLHPCPFCGGTDLHKVGGAFAAGAGQSFGCKTCHALGPWGKTHADAVGQWNCRADFRRAVEPAAVVERGGRRR